MFRKIILLTAISFALAACGSSNQSVSGFDTPVPNQVQVHQDTDGHTHVHVTESEATVPLQVVIVPSELIVGPNRFAVGLIDAKGQMVKDAAVHLHYFNLRDPSRPLLESEADATRLQTPDGFTTIFAHEREFNRAGDWGVEVQVRFPDGTAGLKRVSFQVLAGSPAKKPGDKVPAVDTPTAADVHNDLSKLTSANKPNSAFYRQSLAKAIASGKPTVLLFATPAFCQTRFCGPDYEIVSALQEKYGDALNFIHVEIYTDLPNPDLQNPKYAPAMLAFGLKTEPWVFLIDGKGTIVYRVEGVMTEGEIDRHIKSLIGS